MVPISIEISFEIRLTSIALSKSDGKQVNSISTTDELLWQEDNITQHQIWMPLNYTDENATIRLVTGTRQKSLLF